MDEMHAWMQALASVEAINSLKKFLSRIQTKTFKRLNIQKFHKFLRSHFN